MDPEDRAASRPPRRGTWGQVLPPLLLLVALAVGAQLAWQRAEKQRDERVEAIGTPPAPAPDPGWEAAFAGYFESHPDHARQVLTARPLMMAATLASVEVYQSKGYFPLQPSEYLHSSAMAWWSRTPEGTPWALIMGEPPPDRLEPYRVYAIEKDLVGGPQEISSVFSALVIPTFRRDEGALRLTQMLSASSGFDFLYGGFEQPLHPLEPTLIPLADALALYIQTFGEPPVSLKELLDKSGLVPVAARWEAVAEELGAIECWGWTDQPGRCALVVTWQETPWTVSSNRLFAGAPPNDDPATRRVRWSATWADLAVHALHEAEFRPSATLEP